MSSSSKITILGLSDIGVASVTYDTISGDMEEALKELFSKTFGEPAESAEPMKGDGSGRRLWRLKNARRSAVGAANLDRLENQAFLRFSRHFRLCGLPVPEIYGEDASREMYLEEDLGDTNLFQYLGARRAAQGFPPEVVDVYRKAVRLLPRFQVEAAKTLDDAICYPRAAFDKQSMLWDLNHFKYYFLQLAQIPFHEAALEEDFRRFADFLLEADARHLLLRDFQSRNIMVRQGEPWFIDYQGARRGALQYDIASLLFDAKADVPFDLRQELLELYLDEASRLVPIDRARFMKYYPGFVYIRIMQALGAYGLRGFYERKPHFLQSIPYAIRNIERMLRTTELPLEVPSLMEVFRSLAGSSKLRQYGEARLGLTVRVQSFSFRSGAPQDERGHGGGFVFDCRALPNPGKFPRYAALDGRDPEIAAFLSREPAVERFLEHAVSLVAQSVENYRTRNFTDLMVAFGCTGGRHRSVYCAEKLAGHLREKYGIRVELKHAALEKESAAVPS